MRLMSKSEDLIVPKGTKFTGSGKLGLNVFHLKDIGEHLTSCGYPCLYSKV